MNSLFYKASTKDNLVKALYDTIFHVQFALIDVLNNSKKYQVITFEELTQNLNRSNRIVENIIKKRIPEKEIKNLLLEVFQIYPYKDQYYELLLKNDVKPETVKRIAYIFSVNITKLFFEDLKVKNKKGINTYNQDRNFSNPQNIIKNKILDLEKIIITFCENYQYKIAGRIQFGQRIEDNQLEKHKLKYLNIKKDEQLLVLINKFGFLGQSNAFAITNKNIYYYLIKNNSLMMGKIEGVLEIKNINSIRIGETIYNIINNKTFNTFIVNNKVLGLIDMKTQLSKIDINSITFLNGLLNIIINEVK